MIMISATTLTAATIRIYNYTDYSGDFDGDADDDYDSSCR